jgi:hypothetical protein
MNAFSLYYPCIESRQIYTMQQSAAVMLSTSSVCLLMVREFWKKHCALQGGASVVAFPWEDMANYVGRREQFI